MKAAGLIILLALAFNAKAQDEETLFMSVDVGINACYAPWKSFSEFRKAYNTVNDSSLSNKLGSLSSQYGFNVGTDFFVTRHLISAVDYTKAYGKASATFSNGSKRVMRSDINTISTTIGWLQGTEKGYWSLSTGIDASFGVIRSTLVFADGTKYTHTGGLSGEFRDVAIGLPLKFELARPLSEKLFLKITAQADYYFEVYDEGMQNTFVTMTQSNLSSGDKVILYDVSSLTLSAGLTYKFLRK